MMRELTEAELVADLRRLFGDEPSAWAFECPCCHDVAVAADFAPFTESGFGSDLLGQICIGRKLGALDKAYTSSDDYRAQGGRGCDWAAGGLFQGPWFIVREDGRKTPCFPIAGMAS